MRARFAPPIRMVWLPSSCAESRGLGVAWPPKLSGLAALWASAVAGQEFAGDGRGPAGGAIGSAGAWGRDLGWGGDCGRDCACGWGGSGGGVTGCRADLGDGEGAWTSSPSPRACLSLPSQFDWPVLGGTCAGVEPDSSYISRFHGGTGAGTGAGLGRCEAGLGGVGGGAGAGFGSLRVEERFGGRSRG
ncbi:hypothetical protein BH23PLA1_BH23PLA1_24820 [soil metagenome]